MAVKVLIKRKLQGDKYYDLTELLKKMRVQCLNQPGYIKGETLSRIDIPDESLVISTWKDLDAWNEWQNNKERIDVQNEIDFLLQEPTGYEVYQL